MNNHEVISALLDNEDFDPHELSVALADQYGRELLVDLAVLRRLVQPVDVPGPTQRPRMLYEGHRFVQFGVAAAIVLLSALAGSVLLDRVEDSSVVPPPPTAVIAAETGWQTVPEGGFR